MVEPSTEASNGDTDGREGHIVIGKRPENRSGDDVSATTLFKTFDRKISARTQDEDAALKRGVDCAMALTSHFYDPSASASNLMTLIGSLVRSTAIRPIGDVDVTFPIPYSTYEKYDRYSSNGQSALLQEVRTALQRRFHLTEIRGDGPVVVVDFTTGPAVEVVPTVLSTRSDSLHVSGWVPVTREGGRWESVDYGAQFDRFAAIDSARSSQASRLMRYMKVWRRQHSAVLKSVVMELMVNDFFTAWDTARSRTSHTWDDWLVRDFLEYMVKNQDTIYHLASGTALTAGYGWRQDAAAAYRHAAAACREDDGSSRYISYFREVFGSDFG